MTRLLTVNQFMGETGTKPTLTWKLIREGTLPVVRAGRRVLIARETLERFVAGELTRASRQAAQKHAGGEA